MKNIFKKLFIPSGQKQSVVAYKSWIVRWQSASFGFSGSSYANLKDESEIFPSEEDANKYADQLVAAYKLTKSNLSGKVRVIENQSKLATLVE